MSRKRKRGAKATAASMVMDTLKKRGAVDEKSAVDVSVFKICLMPLQQLVIQFRI